MRSGYAQLSTEFCGELRLLWPQGVTPKPWDGQKALHHQDPAITDALGNPLDFISTAGQADVGQADAWLQLTPTGDLPGGKGYDSNAFIQAIHKKGMQAVIPLRSNCIAPRNYGWFMYIRNAT